MQWVGSKPSALYLVDSKNLLSIGILHGYGFEDIADLCGVSVTEVQSWWDGVKSIPIDNAYKIAETIGIRI